MHRILLVLVFFSFFSSLSDCQCMLWSLLLPWSTSINMKREGAPKNWPRAAIICLALAVPYFYVAINLIFSITIRCTVVRNEGQYLLDFILCRSRRLFKFSLFTRVSMAASYVHLRYKKPSTYVYLYERKKSTVRPLYTRVTVLVNVQTYSIPFTYTRIRDRQNVLHFPVTSGSSTTLFYSIPLFF